MLAVWSSVLHWPRQANWSQSAWACHTNPVEYDMTKECVRVALFLFRHGSASGALAFWQT